MKYLTYKQRIDEASRLLRELKVLIDRRDEDVESKLKLIDDVMIVLGGGRIWNETPIENSQRCTASVRKSDLAEQ